MALDEIIGGAVTTEVQAPDFRMAGAGFVLLGAVTGAMAQDVQPVATPTIIAEQCGDSKQNDQVENLTPDNRTLIEVATGEGEFGELVGFEGFSYHRLELGLSDEQIANKKGFLNGQGEPASFRDILGYALSELGIDYKVQPIYFREGDYESYVATLHAKWEFETRLANRELPRGITLDTVSEYDPTQPSWYGSAVFRLDAGAEGTRAFNYLDSILFQIDLEDAEVLARDMISVSADEQERFAQYLHINANELNITLPTFDAARNYVAELVADGDTDTMAKLLVASNWINRYISIDIVLENGATVTDNLTGATYIVTSDGEAMNALKARWEDIRSGVVTKDSCRNEG